MANEQILVVDDSKETIILVKEILSPLGYRIVTALDGVSGLELAIQLNPDLILLDMNMPRMTGLEMLAALRQTACTSPVIFMTVYGSEHIVVEAFRLGVRDYLNKSLLFEEIEQTINRALRETRLERERMELSHNLLTAEAVRMTVITLSHYLNNTLMSLKGNLALLDEALRLALPDPEMLKLVQESQQGAVSIQTVMKILQRATNVRLTSYTDTTSILDIETAVRKELSQMPEFSRSKT